MSDIEQRAIATVRGLSMDMPHKARSGHQGTAMALAPAAHVLFTVETEDRDHIAQLFQRLGEAGIKIVPGRTS